MTKNFFYYCLSVFTVLLISANANTFAACNDRHIYNTSQHTVIYQFKIYNFANKLVRTDTGLIGSNANVSYNTTYHDNDDHLGAITLNGVELNFIARCYTIYFADPLNRPTTIRLNRKETGEKPVGGDVRITD